MHYSRVFHLVNFGFKCTFRFIILVKYCFRSYMIPETACIFYNKLLPHFAVYQESKPIVYGMFHLLAIDQHVAA
jgi:hypothetical protein